MTTDKTFLSKIKPDDLVIIHASGVIGRETAPKKVTEVSKTEIRVGQFGRFSKSTGNEIEELGYERNEENEKVKQKPNPYPARIVRLATSEDIAKQESERAKAAESQKAIEANNQRMEEIAKWFPAECRPAVSDAWSGQGLRLEFDGLSEVVVRQIAELIKGVL